MSAQFHPRQDRHSREPPLSRSHGYEAIGIIHARIAEVADKIWLDDHRVTWPDKLPERIPIPRSKVFKIKTSSLRLFPYSSVNLIGASPYDADILDTQARPIQVNRGGQHYNFGPQAIATFFG